MSAERKDHLDGLAVLILLSCCSIWGVAQVAAKLTLTELPPLLQSGLRSAGAAVLLLLWSQWRGLRVFDADGTGRAGVLAGVMFAAEFACIFVGLQFTTASRMSVFLYLAPFVVALGMPLISRSERLSPWQMLGLVLAFGGVVWAFAEGFVRPAAGPLLALAFHVKYWDRLGWPDRFASPEATARQHELAALAGRQQVYTPQVIVNGRDWRQWPQLPAAQAGTAIRLVLGREGNEVTARVASLQDSTAQLAGYWAVLEDGHLSQVRAGENAGRTLRHDHVVRLYQPVPAWAAASGSTSTLRVSAGVASHPRRVVFVVTDASTQRPLQALALGC